MELSLKFNKSQLERLSEILGNLGLVFLAALVLPALTGTRLNPGAIASGIMLSFGCITISLAVLKEV